GVLEVGPGVAGEIGATADEAGDHVAHGVDAVAAGHPGGDALPGLPGRQLGLPPLEAPPAQTGLELGAVAVPALERLLPLAPEALPAGDGLAVQLEDLVGDPERLLWGKAEDLLGDLDFVFAEGRAVG